MYAIDYEDFGTPAAGERAGAAVTVEIDGRAVTVPEGTSVMRAAALAGVKMPKLCATDTLKAFGSCRLCLVQIEGRKGYPASCTTTVAAGMKVRTQSKKLLAAAPRRDGAVHLRSSARLPDLPGERHCELQDMARSVGLREVRTATAGRQASAAAEGQEQSLFHLRPGKCIVCSRCVRACDEQQGTFALTIQGRGFDSKVCGEPERVLHGLRVRLLRRLRGGLPDRDAHREVDHRPGRSRARVTTTCAYCGVGCG